MLNIAHVRDSRPGNQIQACLIRRHTKKNSPESYLLLPEQCLEKTRDCDSCPTYELICGAKHLLVASKLPVSLDVSWKEIRCMNMSRRWKTSLDSAEYLHFGRDKAPGDHVRFPNFLQLWFSLTIKRCNFLPHKEEIFLLILYSVQIVCFPLLKPNTFIMQPCQWDKHLGHVLLSLLSHRYNRMMLAQKTFIFHGDVLYKL